MSDTPDGWIETPTGRIPDPRKQKPLRSHATTGEGPNSSPTKMTIPQIPRPGSDSANSPAGAPVEAKKSRKGSGLLVLVFIVVVVVGAWKPISGLVSTATSSFSSELSSPSDSSSEADDDEGEDDAASPARGDDFYADTDYNEADKRIPGKTWDGTANLSYFKDYKVSVKDCSDIVDDEGALAVRCVLQWTNPYSTTISDGDQLYPRLEFAGDSDSIKVEDVWPSDEGRYADEPTEDHTVKAGQTDEMPFYFSDAGTRNVWISYDRWTKESDGYVTTTIAKVDTQTLSVTNAKK